MHIEYAQELQQYNAEQAKKWNWEKDPDLLTVQAFVKEREFIKFARDIGSDKTKSILDTIEKEADNKYFKITDKMKFSVASDILSKATIDEIINIFNK